MKAAKKTRSTAAIKRLYEDLWIALGPKHATDRGGAERALARMQRTAETVRIRKIMDPLDAKVWSGGNEASKRYQTYKDGQSVAEWIGEHGDGGHLRLDVQRGCIRLVPPPKPHRSAAKPRKAAR